MAVCLVLMPPMRMAEAEIMTAGVTAEVTTSSGLTCRPSVGRPSGREISTSVFGLQEDDGLRFGGKSFADWADLFGGFEFDRNVVDGELQGFGEFVADGLAMIGQLDFFEDDGGIDIDELEAGVAGQFLGVGEKMEAVAVFPLGVGIGEMHADVA